jgi:hypothetical protein
VSTLKILLQETLVNALLQSKAPAVKRRISDIYMDGVMTQIIMDLYPEIRQALIQVNVYNGAGVTDNARLNSALERTPKGSMDRTHRCGAGVLTRGLNEQ